MDTPPRTGGIANRGEERGHEGCRVNKKECTRAPCALFLGQALQTSRANAGVHARVEKHQGRPVPETHTTRRVAEHSSRGIRNVDRLAEGAFHVPRDATRAPAAAALTRVAMVRICAMCVRIGAAVDVAWCRHSRRTGVRAIVQIVDGLGVAALELSVPPRATRAAPMRAGQMRVRIPTPGHEAGLWRHRLRRHSFGRGI